MKEIALAINERVCIEFDYDGKRRIVEPHIVGANQKGHAVMRAYQVGGDSTGALPAWRLFDLTKVSNIAITKNTFEPRFADGYKFNDLGITMAAAAVSRMEVYYALQDLESAKEKPSIFLAGPTPRDKKNVPTWRPEALMTLCRLGFEGAVFVPENSTWAAHDQYDEQIEWEWTGLDMATIVAFWVPRDIATMPAFTTNVEFGMKAQSKKVVLGYPPNAPKMRYLHRLADRYGITVVHTMEDTLKEAIRLCQ